MMMLFQKNIRKYVDRQDLPFFLLVVFLGCINHFVYDWSHGLALAALFCPVSESTWEHLKLLFFPFLLSSLLYYYKYKPRTARFLYSRFLGAVCGICSIIVLFYTYTGITGQSFLIIDILIFCLSTGLSFLMSSFFLPDSFFYSFQYRICCALDHPVLRIFLFHMLSLESPIVFPTRYSIIKLKISLINLRKE